MLTGPRARGRELADEIAQPGAARRPEAAPKPGGILAAEVSRLQAHAGNRATAILLGGLGGRRSVQRDALAGTIDESTPGVDPQAGNVDPASLTGDGESGAKPSDWAQPGAGGDGPAPPLPATTDAGTAGGAGGGSSAGGGQGIVDQATNLMANAIGGSAVPLAGGGGQPVGGQVTGSPTAGGGQATQGSGTPPAPGAPDWTLRPEGAAIVKVLSASTIGQEALAAAAKYAVVVVFQAKGRPAAYDAGDNHCYLDPATATNELATYFVHEMYHARQSQLGLSPLPDKAPDREAWVDSMVQEEVTATYRSFEARVEAGMSTPLAAGPLAEAWTQYLRVRRHWREQHLASHPNDAAGAEAFATAQGRAIVRLQIVGEPGGRHLPMLGADQGRSYADYYRTQWNTAHRARP
jgi:hypothetical protein